MVWLLHGASPTMHVSRERLTKRGSQPPDVASGTLYPSHAEADAEEEEEGGCIS
jgi:hypothetical protein